MEGDTAASATTTTFAPPRAVTRRAAVDGGEELEVTVVEGFSDKTMVLVTCARTRRVGTWMLASREAKHAPLFDVEVLLGDSHESVAQQLLARALAEKLGRDVLVGLGLPASVRGSTAAVVEATRVVVEVVASAVVAAASSSR